MCNSAKHTVMNKKFSYHLEQGISISYAFLIFFVVKFFSIIAKHNTCSGNVNGKVNVVLCNVVKLLLLWRHLGKSFESSSSESFLGST